MVREQNVKLMSRIAIYEKRAGKKEIPMHKFYKGDYVRLNCLKSVVSATIVFVLAAVLVIIYKMEYLLTNILKMNYVRIAVITLAVYAVWVFLYWLVARIIYAARYEKARSNIIIYNHHLKKLQEEGHKEMVKAKGGVVIGDDFIDF